MSDNNPELNDVTLEDFEKDFYNRPDPELPLEPEPDPEDVLEEETLEDDSLANEETPEDEPEDNPEPPKKKSFQDRIDELTAARREAERQAAELKARLDALEVDKAKPEVKQEPAPEAKTAPDPNELNPDGEAKYPLGEFDPAFVRDLVNYENDQKWAQYKEQLEREAVEKEMAKQAAEAQTALSNEWNQKLEAVQEALPDIREKGARLVEEFATLEPAHGEYLATAIMKLPNGPEVLYYLADNPEVAKKIAYSDPLTAAIELGVLNAQYQDTAKSERRVKVSDAPPPPPVRTRGASGRFSVPGDTDDLDAFEKVFLSKGR